MPIPAPPSSPAPTRPADRTGLAVVFMLLSAAGFTVMGVAVREAGDLPLVQKVFLRNVMTAGIALVVVLRDARPSILRWHDHTWRVVLRSVVGLLGVACFFYALEKLPLADATMLNKLSPFFVLLLAWAALHERLSRPLVFSMVAAFAGALLIIKPRFDLTVVPALVGAASAVFAATAYTLVRSLRGLEPPHRIVFAFSAISTVVLLPLAALYWASPTGPQWGALLLIGLGAAAGQFGLTYAYQLAPAGRISIVNYSAVVFALIAGWALWGEWPDGWSLLGGAAIIVAALFSQRSAQADPAQD